MILGSLSGLAAAASYGAIIGLSAAFPNWPDQAWLALGSSIGVFFAIFALSLATFLCMHRATASAKAAGALAFAGGVLFSTMIVVQLNVQGQMDRRITAAREPALQDALRQDLSGLRTVDLALDLAWNVFLVAGSLLFAVNMFGHPRLGPIVGFTGLALTIVLAGVNLYAFPSFPEEIGLPYVFGPALSLWYALVAILMLGSVRWAARSGGA